MKFFVQTGTKVHEQGQILQADTSFQLPYRVMVSNMSRVIYKRTQPKIDAAGVVSVFQALLACVFSPKAIPLPLIPDELSGFWGAAEEPSDPHPQCQKVFPAQVWVRILCADLLLVFVDRSCPGA